MSGRWLSRRGITRSAWPRTSSPGSVTNPAEELSWNLRALELARKIGDDRVIEYFASFNGCVGHSYERLGEPERARPYLEEGLRRLADVFQVMATGRTWNRTSARR